MHKAAHRIQAEPWIYLSDHLVIANPFSECNTIFAIHRWSNRAIGYNVLDDLPRKSYHTGAFDIKPYSPIQEALGLWDACA